VPSRRRARPHDPRQAPSPPRNTAAFQAFAAATLPVYEIAGEDPDLPAALLPPDWPGQHVGATLHRAFQVFGPLLEDYLATVTDHEAARPTTDRATRASATNHSHLIFRTDEPPGAAVTSCFAFIEARAFLSG
jgi:hypothetical protein